MTEVDWDQPVYKPSDRSPEARRERTVEVYAEAGRRLAADPDRLTGYTPEEHRAAARDLRAPFDPSQAILDGVSERGEQPEPAGGDVGFVAPPPSWVDVATCRVGPGVQRLYINGLSITVDAGPSGGTISSGTIVVQCPTATWAEWSACRSFRL